MSSSRYAFFFFQAEDGIRDYKVNGVQTCALPISGEDAGEGGTGTPGERDSLFRQAAEVCIQNQLGSTSLLQRRMSIGYGRAARIIDQLELAGILGPANGSKPRDVLLGLEELDEICGGQ